MYFYPRALKSQWYMAEVCRSIETSLEGIKNWTVWYYVSPIDREAYLETFARCQQIVRDNDLKPDAMLQALSDLHDEVLSMAPPSYLSRARWFHAPLEAREQAVITAFSIVESVCERFLP